MDKKINKKVAEHPEYDEETMSKIRIYREIKSGLNRIKNEEIDDILNKSNNLEEIVKYVDASINNYEQLRILFKSWIFEGQIPENFALENDINSTEHNIFDGYDFSNIPESAYDDPNAD